MRWVLLYKVPKITKTEIAKGILTPKIREGKIIKIVSLPLLFAHLQLAPSRSRGFHSLCFLGFWSTDRFHPRALSFQCACVPSHHGLWDDTAGVRRSDGICWCRAWIDSCSSARRLDTDRICSNSKSGDSVKWIRTRWGSPVSFLRVDSISRVFWVGLWFYSWALLTSNSGASGDTIGWGSRARRWQRKIQKSDSSEPWVDCSPPPGRLRRVPPLRLLALLAFHRQWGTPTPWPAPLLLLR